MARALPSYVPFEFASDDFLVYKAIQLFARGKPLPKKLVAEIKRRGLVSKLPPEIQEAYFNGYANVNGNGKIDLVKLYYRLGMIKEARELAWRMEMFSSFRFELDGYFRGKPAMILELSVDYVKMMVDGGDIISVPLHVFEAEFVPANNA